MEDNIKISIVVPVYNVQDYLKKCIESIMKQSYKNMEIILVDDGSTDGSPEICDFYESIDRRIVVIHKKNGGVTSARKAGVGAATGDYVLSVDGDDWIETDRIEELVTRGILPAKADMVYMAGYKKDDEECSQISYCDVEEKTYYDCDIEKHFFPLYCGVGEELFNIKVLLSMDMWAVRRELIQDKIRIIDDRILMGEDDFCVGCCILSAKCITVIRQSGYHYIQRNSSIMHISKDYDVHYIESANILYHQLKQYLEDHTIYFKETRMCLVNSFIMETIIAHYDMFLKKHKYYLYPFADVRKGSVIIVYGAGAFGHAIVKCIANAKEYHVALWVDQNIRKTVLADVTISSVKEIKSVDYDYIVVAIMSSDTSKKVKEILVNMGISEKKIARINPGVITEDALPDEILCDCEKLNQYLGDM